VRLECSGLLPAEIDLPDSLPPAFCAALLLASPFWEKPAILTLPQAALPLARQVASILRQAGADLSLDGNRARVAPCALSLPAAPDLPVDQPLCCCLLALPALAAGTVRLEGRWQNAENASGLAFIRSLGVDLAVDDAGLTARREMPEVAEGDIPTPPRLIWSEETDRLAREAWEISPENAPLVTALAAAAAVQGQTVFLPFAEQEVPFWYEEEISLTEDADPHILAGFLACMGLNRDDRGLLAPCEPDESGEPVRRSAWISPSALWAVGLSLAAFARPNLHLANPGVLTGRYPGFWNLYNGLPRPAIGRNKTEEAHAQPTRRRIIAAGVLADLPPERPAGDD